MKRLAVVISLLLFLSMHVNSQEKVLLPEGKAYKWYKKALHTLPGAYQLKEYLPLLRGKRVAVFANQTTVIGQAHLVDSLKSLGIHIVKIFGPEHGFRGTADAGEHVESYIDKETGIKVVSLYGAKSTPSTTDLDDVDVTIFDLQDVGLRFFTYIVSLQHFLEGCIDNNKPVILLDRPNPNGFYVDGPVLDMQYKSGVGPQPIPVVHGMTMGEYAHMLIGEHWLKTKTAYTPSSVQLTVIKCKKYDHRYLYTLPVKPSPNLPTMSAIYWYASTCFFEGTNLSEGRGTEHPFTTFGHPDLPKALFSFTPSSRPGAKSSKLYDQTCYGWDITDTPMPQHIDLKWLIQAYQLFPDKNKFFLMPKDTTKPENFFFNKLAGNDILMQQIKNNISESEIRASWQAGLAQFKAIRKKYLLYRDFE
ncbi:MULTISPECIES: exo-beta-N-acetylmuramidase NamZ family protein [Chitinophagaceae]